MSKRLLVKQCSPTMAGLKTGNLFTCEAKSRPDLVRFVRAMNRKFAYKGLKMAIMRYSSGRALIYMYRPAKLRKDFECELVKTILAKEGYPVEDSERCIIELMKRLNRNSEFPHEIGLFLGYPPEDVKGFIENGAKDAKCVGTWKVYGNEEEARKKFDQYDKCSRVYAECFRRHMSLEKLIVAV